MKRIQLLFVLLVLALGVSAQEDKQFVMNSTAKLDLVVGQEYPRAELSAEDIKLADSLVNHFVQANYRHYDWSRKIENYYDYYRQYAAYKESPSRIILIINAFRHNKNPGNIDLREQFVVARGGGSNFFQVKVDLFNKTCFDLRVNAPK